MDYKKVEAFFKVYEKKHESVTDHARWSLLMIDDAHEEYTDNKNITLEEFGYLVDMILRDGTE